MPLITLTTDFGLKDPSVAAVKGALYSELSDAQIVDISHLISPFHIAEAAYIIKNAYKTFPPGSIHILGVDSELTPENRHIAVELDEHYFICANNGIMSLIANEIVPTNCVEINIHNRVVSNFPVLDVFVQVAAHIARGGKLGVIGKKTDILKPLKNLIPVVNKAQNQILGSVMYIDNYGNAISNISRKFFNTIGRGREYTISARGFRLKKIYDNYSEVVDYTVPKEDRLDGGKNLALFNTADYLEIAIYKSNPHSVGSASTLLGLKINETIKINFK